MKAKFKLCGLVLMLSLILCSVSAANAALPDVSGHWAQPQIEKWSGKGLAKGYPDGTFKPDGKITRAEFVTLINRAYGKQDPGAKCGFADVAAGDWYYADVSTAAKLGYVRGYEDNTFRPANPISRAEAGVIVAKLLNLTAADEGALVKFSDAGDIGGWARAGVAALVEKKLISGYSDGTLKPGSPITRAESIVIMDNALASGALDKGTVAAVKLSTDSVTISVGETRQLTASVEPDSAVDKSVQWSSSDEKIATVDKDGKVTGKGQGAATITVTTTDGSKKATCTVKVAAFSGGGGGGGTSGGGGGDTSGGGSVTPPQVTAKTYANSMSAGATWVINNFTGKDLIYIGQAGFDLGQLFNNSAGASYSVNNAAAGDYILTGSTLKAAPALASAKEVEVTASVSGSSASISVLLGLSANNLPSGGEALVYSRITAAPGQISAKSYPDCKAAGATWVVNNFTNQDAVYIGQAGFDASKLFNNSAGASYSVSGANAGDYTLSGATLKASAQLAAAKEADLTASSGGVSASIKVVLGLSANNQPSGGELIVYSVN